MTISPASMERVRERANFACEYCGVTENDTGGQLTVDHFQPQSQHGSDDPENLLYCCYRCNLHKADYWPAGPNDPRLWNPRRELFTEHYLTLADGNLHPLTDTGEFTLRRLRLNRHALVENRLRRHAHAEELRLLTRYEDLLRLFQQLHHQQMEMLEENRQLLEEQKRLLQILLNLAE